MALAALDKLINGNDLVTYTDLLKTAVDKISEDNKKYTDDSIKKAVTDAISASY